MARRVLWGDESLSRRAVHEPPLALALPLKTLIPRSPLFSLHKQHSISHGVRSTDAWAPAGLSACGVEQRNGEPWLTTIPISPPPLRFLPPQQSRQQTRRRSSRFRRGARCRPGRLRRSPSSAAAELRCASRSGTAAAIAVRCAVWTSPRPRPATRSDPSAFVRVSPSLPCSLVIFKDRRLTLCDFLCLSVFRAQQQQPSSVSFPRFRSSPRCADLSRFAARSQVRCASRCSSSVRPAASAGTAGAVRSAGRSGWVRPTPTAVQPVRARPSPLLLSLGKG